MMRWLWAPFLLALCGCSIMVPSLPLPARSPTPAAAAVTPPETFRLSVVRLYGAAPLCGKSVEGTGFVYAPQRVVTAAHVVAGVIPSTSVVTTDDGDEYEAEVVAFDPDVDVAVLYVPDLPAPALRIAEARPGDVHMVGYPKDAGHAMMRPVEIEQRFEAEGPNLYREREVIRMVLSFSGEVSPGMSGAPLITAGDTVAGMVFAANRDQAHHGYALPPDELLPITDAARAATRRVSTQKCDS
ncbi:trypsin-like peptidase domain-containing protein [Nonomuraea polychroma]|uniref:trypsin-like peptidase domain-containing protein n=1 Tax=Nonomuraea polychroma TaxID=46176 RepID=UPI003D8B291F